MLNTERKIWLYCNPLQKYFFLDASWNIIQDSQSVVPYKNNPKCKPNVFYEKQVSWRNVNCTVTMLKPSHTKSRLFAYISPVFLDEYQTPLWLSSHSQWILTQDPINFGLKLLTFLKHWSCWHFVNKLTNADTSTITFSSVALFSCSSKSSISSNMVSS